MMSVFSKDNGGAFPDAMNFALYSSEALYGLVPIGTLDPLTFSLAARADLPSNALPKFETFDSFSSMIDDSRYIPAPVIRPFNTNPSPVPEPSSLVFAATGAVLLLIGKLNQFRF